MTISVGVGGATHTVSAPTIDPAGVGKAPSYGYVGLGGGNYGTFLAPAQSSGGSTSGGQYAVVSPTKTSTDSNPQNVGVGQTASFSFSASLNDPNGVLHGPLKYSWGVDGSTTTQSSTSSTINGTFVSNSSGTYHVDANVTITDNYGDGANSGSASKNGRITFIVS